MFKSLVVALDLGDHGDRALLTTKALASPPPVKVALVTVSYPGTPTDADSWESSSVPLLSPALPRR